MASSSSSRPMNLEEDAFAEILYQGEKIGSSASPKFHDVFINHRGPDVKQTLGLKLYNALEEAEIRAFLDCKEMELGDLFPSTIQKAIYSAFVHIAIFSPTYARSVWCLAELALMLRTNKKIIPIFYDVTPSDLRYAKKGKGVYADSFKYHKKKGRHLHKLDSWKEALRCVSFIMGYEFNPNNDNLETLCQKIVAAVRREVETTRTLQIAKFPTGIEEWVEDFKRVCWQKDKVIGIYGMGGSGKTTLAKALFNQWRSNFSASSFLFDVRETKLTTLQRKLLMDLVQEKKKFYNIPEGCTYLRSRLASNISSENFLIIIDDIDEVDQLDALVVRDLLVNNSRSLIIVTTRDERVLIRAEINCRYKMKGMSVHDSTELFCRHAFRQQYPISGYEDLVESFVKECGGLPFSLQVFGGHVFGSGNKRYWEQELDKVRKTLRQDLKQRLRISVESLDNEQMQVFLDIACFFVNKPRHMALRILEASGWSAEHTLQMLMDKCLVEVEVGRSYWNVSELESIPLLRMHDHIRDLGREIADEELSTPHRLWRFQHLHHQEEVGFENTLAEIRQREFRCLNSIFDNHTAVEFRFFLVNSSGCDGPSNSLLWLEVDSSLSEMLHQDENIQAEIMSTVSSSATIPSWIPLQCLQYLKISHGCFRRLWEFDQQVPLQLKDLILEETNLEEFPKSLRMLTQLENLVIEGKEEWNGREWNSSMQIQGILFSESLTNLLNLKNFVLKDFILDREIRFKNSMISLEKIVMRDLKRISKVSVSGQHLINFKYLHLECMESLVEVDLGLDAKLHTEGGAVIEELPSSACPCNIEKIIIDGCWKLQKISGIEKLQGLKYLHLSAGTEAIRDTIEMWQKVPSEVASLIWEADVDTESILQNFNSLCYFIGLDGRVTEIPNIPQAEIVIPIAVEPSAIIIFMLIESFHEGKDCRRSLKIPPMDWMVSYIGKGKYIVAVVVSEEGKIKKMQSEMSRWIPVVSDGKVIMGFIATMRKRAERKTLTLLQHLCSKEVFSPLHFSEININPSMQEGVQEVIGRLHLSRNKTDYMCRYISNDDVSVLSLRRRSTPLTNWMFQFKQINKAIQRKFSSDYKNPSTFLVRLEVEFISPQKFDSLECVVREVMTSVSSPLTGSPRVQLRSLRYLKISGGNFRSLWWSDRQTPLQLKELVLDGIKLTVFPHSLEMLRHLENLVIAGTARDSSIMFEGNSFSESVSQLTNLRSLVLRNLIFCGALRLSNRPIMLQSNTLGTPEVKLQKIEIRNVEGISMISIRRRYLGSLECLHLERLESLIKVDLGCYELPSSACPRCLANVIVYNCRILEKIEGIEELQGLKYLHLEPSFASVIAREIERDLDQPLGTEYGYRDLYQGISSYVTWIIWRSNISKSDSEEQEKFEASAAERSVIKIPSDPEEDLLIPFTEETSAIVVFMSINNCPPNGWIEFLGIPPMEEEWEWRGAAVVVRCKEKIKKISPWIRSVRRSGVNVVSIIFWKGES